MVSKGEMWVFDWNALRGHTAKLWLDTYELTTASCGHIKAKMQLTNLRSLKWVFQIPYNSLKRLVCSPAKKFRLSGLRYFRQ